MSLPASEGSDDDYRSCAGSGTSTPDALERPKTMNADSPTSWEDGEEKALSFYCQFCKQGFQADDEFRTHCNSAEHRMVLMSDDGHEWKFRPPPRGVPLEEYVTCERHLTYGQCRLGSQCCEAHSEEELEEWRERHNYRERRLQEAQEHELEGYHKYAEDLLRRFSEARDPASMNAIMTTSLKGLRVSCKQNLKLTVKSKETQHVWDFELHTITPLRRVVLLRDDFRNHFYLEQVRVSVFIFNLPPDCQEWINNLSNKGGGRNVLTYLVRVGFRSSMYATYAQTLVFDFGGSPVLAQYLNVDVVPPDTFSDIQHQRRQVVSGKSRWTPANVDLGQQGTTNSGGSECDATAESLASLYPVPDPETFQLTQAVVGKRMGRDNYSARMHELLYVEEMARADIVSQYNIQVCLDIVDSISTSSATETESLYAQGGELYAKLNLEEQLTEDTPAGRLALHHCQLVWLAAVSTSQAAGRKRRVYQAPIERAKQKCVYLKLSKQCVDELKLKPRTEFHAEVQFLLDRLPLCEMHYAIDKLTTATLVFPDFKVKPPEIDPRTTMNWDPRLNEDQKKAVACIVAPRTARDVPPVLVVGPFGTGKTFTLAQGVLATLRQPNTRVLICTHSNSAADLYILDHLDKHVHNFPEVRPIRILYQGRKLNRVDRRLLPYCLKVPRDQQSPQGPWFRQPTKEELEEHRVVVTTLSSSRMLLASGIEKGFFSHIFIDEAAQVMEAACILPLALADPMTRVVLAGDYMQLNPEVFSVFTREHRLHISLLERLHDYYPLSHPCRIILRDNYRSHEALVHYTSECFYQGKLEAAARPAPHHLLSPLTFFAARGCDIPKDGSTSYVNHCEVSQVRDVVKEIVSKWPSTWGLKDASQIAVVTPYYDQVVSIRAELRRHRLGDVKVESVANVQGREFRAVILSTVRTRATCLELERGTLVKEALDFGFLSNPKLLNTAITRAQSIVIVVGDPISLCSVGACRKLWEKFIRTCDDTGSLYNIRWQDISYQLEGFELKKEYGLNPHAENFWPSQPFLNVPPSPQEPPAQNSHMKLQAPDRAAPTTAPNGFWSYMYPSHGYPGMQMSSVDRRLYNMVPPEHYQRHQQTWARPQMYMIPQLQQQNQFQVQHRRQQERAQQQFPVQQQEYQLLQQQYWALQQQYHASQQHHQAPQTQYQVPQQQYQAPRQQYQAPRQQYQAPRQQYQAPLQQYQVPHQQYQGRPEQYQMSQQHYQSEQPQQQFQAQQQQQHYRSQQQHQYPRQPQYQVHTQDQVVQQQEKPQKHTQQQPSGTHLGFNPNTEYWDEQPLDMMHPGATSEVQQHAYTGRVFKNNSQYLGHAPMPSSKQAKGIGSESSMAQPAASGRPQVWQNKGTTSFNGMTPADRNLKFAAKIANAVKQRQQNPTTNNQQPQQNGRGRGRVQETKTKISNEFKESLGHTQPSMPPKHVVTKPTVAYVSAITNPVKWETVEPNALVPPRTVPLPIMKGPEGVEKYYKKLKEEDSKEEDVLVSLLQRELSFVPSEAAARVSAPLDATGCLKQTAPPLKQMAPPPKKMAAPLKQAAAPLKQAAAPPKQTVAPLKQTAAPLKQTAAPLKQTATALKQTTATLKQRTAPSNQAPASLRQTTARSKQMTGAASAPVKLTYSEVCRRE